MHKHCNFLAKSLLAQTDHFADAYSQKHVRGYMAFKDLQVGANLHRYRIIIMLSRGVEIVKFSTCPGTSKWP